MHTIAVEHPVGLITFQVKVSEREAVSVIAVIRGGETVVLKL